ncbi:hypothetical protein PTKIN_Ptkin02bG0017500 [Pterospermum kingtungense]
MGGSKCCDKEGLKRGPWTAEEDQKLTTYIQQHGHGNWSALPEKAGLKRCGKSCRLRWINYLRPDIKRGKFSLKEEHTIIQLHALLGNRWSAMAAYLPKRTDNEIKNHWNTHLKKRLIKMGIDPMTHKPRTNASSFPSGSAKKASNLSHMAQWESARLEAEARLVRESKQVVPNPAQTQARPKNNVTRPTSLMINTSSTATPGRSRCLDVLKAWQGVVSDMFAFSSQDLESPTSTLSFPDSTVQVQTHVIGHMTSTGYTDIETGFDHKNASSAGWGETTMELDGQNSFEKSNQMQELHGMTGSIDDAWFDDEDSIFRVGNENVVPIADLVEGLSSSSSDDLVFSYGVLNNAPLMAVEKLSESCSGDIMENSTTNCWDSVLNLVNSSPYGSPVF